jgi:hypothetical protein
LAGGRLIDEKHGRLAEQFDAKTYALPLPAAELSDDKIRPVGEFQYFDGFVHSLPYVSLFKIIRKPQPG